METNEVISISQFKATCLAVLDKVKRTGKPVLVTRRGIPIAMIFCNRRAMVSIDKSDMIPNIGSGSSARISPFLHTTVPP